MQSLVQCQLYGVCQASTAYIQPRIHVIAASSALPEQPAVKQRAYWVPRRWIGTPRSA